MKWQEEGADSLCYYGEAWAQLTQEGGHVMTNQRESFVLGKRSMRCLRTGIVGIAVLAAASLASASPVELKDENGTRYNVNTDVEPLEDNWYASGALTDATFIKPVTVTAYYVGFTPFGFWLTTYTTQYQINVPLTPAFAGFNGLLISGINGVALPQPLVYNPMEGASENCPQNNTPQQLLFQTQSFDSANLVVARQVFVAKNSDFVRWLNIVTNTASTERTIGITLQGFLGSESQTKVGTTSTGDSSITAGDLWFTTGQLTTEGVPSSQPTVGFLVQGDGAAAPAVSLGVNSVGQAIATYMPTIPAGGTAIIMTFASVQGNFKQAKNAMEDLVDLPTPTLNCMTQLQLSQVVNFAKITQPTTKDATITLKFNKTGADTIQWKGKVTIAAGISLQGIPVTVDVGGATASFLLNKSGSANDGGGNKFSLNADLKNGTTKEGTYKFTFNLKGDFQALLAPYGLTNETVKNVSVSVPLSYTVGNTNHFNTEQDFTYKATAGKSGTASSD